MSAEQEGSGTKKRRRKKEKNAVLIFIRDIAVMSIIAFILVYFFKPIVVKQTSMLPTLQQDNYLFLSKQAYNFGKPERGDIIVFPFYSRNGMDYYIKRVIGLPGDRIDIKEGTVYINGDPEDDHYTKDRTTPGDIRKGGIQTPAAGRSRSGEIRQTRSMSTKRSYIRRRKFGHEKGYKQQIFSIRFIDYAHLLPDTDLRSCKR